MTFGLQLTGQLPRFPQTQAEVVREKATQVAKFLGQAIVPQADADGRKSALGERLKKIFKTSEQGE